MLGRLEHYKGVHVLLDAFRQIVDVHPLARLTIRGEGIAGEEFEERARRLGLSQSVCFAGHLSPAEMIRAYHTSTVVVMPSIWPEAFGKVGVETMSAGRPVIVTDVGGVRD